MALTTVKGAVLNRGINVKDFGAKGDGTTDDTAAIQAAITYALTIFPVPAVYIPSGIYRLTQQIISTKSICLFGDGIEQSQLEWGSDSSSQGVSITYNSSRDKAHPYLHDLAFVRTDAYGGTAISIDGSGGGGHADSYRAIIQNVRIDRGNVTVTTGSWEVGILANSVDGCYIDGCSFQGDNNQSTPGTNYYGTFLRVTGNDADNEVVASFNVSNTTANRAEYGVYASNCEGIYIDNFRYFNVDYGVKYDNVGATTATTYSPRCFIKGGHIKARYRGVDFTYTTHCMIRDVYFLDTLLTVTEHIKLTNTLNTTIEDCHFEGLAGSTADGVVIGSSSFDNLVQGCHFSGTGITAIEFDSTSRSNSVGHNFFRYNNWNSYVVNSSADLRWVGGIYRIKTNSNKALASGSTIVSFDSVETNELGSGFSDLGTDATKITIPRKGKYRVSAYQQWAPNNTGYRYLDIRLNGGNAIGTNGQTVVPATGVNTRMTVNSTVLTLSEGDYLQMYVEQTSGGNLDLIVNASLTIEYVGMK